MEVKKNPQKDVHKKRPFFFGIALIITMAMIISAFNVKSSSQKIDVLLCDFEKEIDIIIPPTIIEPPKAPELEPVKAPVFEPVEDEVEVPDVLIDIDDDIDEPIEEPDFEDEPEETADVGILFNDMLEKKAEFRKGGMKGFYKFVKKKLRYPAQARRLGLQGRVTLSFIIDKEGNLSDIKVLKGIGAGCDEEAIRVLKASPKWKPAKQRGRAVKVRMIIPIFYKLN